MTLLSKINEGRAALGLSTLEVLPDLGTHCDSCGCRFEGESLAGARCVVCLTSIAARMPLDVQAELEEVRAERDSARGLLRTWSRLLLDKPEDRLYHASDSTWWSRETALENARSGPALRRAEPPAIVKRMVLALRAAAELDYLSGRLYPDDPELDSLDAEYGPKWIARYRAAWKRVRGVVKELGIEWDGE